MTTRQSSRFLRHRSSSNALVEMGAASAAATETWKQQQEMVELLVASDDEEEPCDVLGTHSDEEDRSSSDTDSSLSLSSSSSASMQQDHDALMLLNRGDSGMLMTQSLHSSKGRLWKRFQPKKKEDKIFDVDLYMTKREMTRTQERWNAVTVLPNPAYCIYFLLTAQWLSSSAGIIDVDASNDESSWMMNAANQLFGADEHGCLNTNGTSSWWHSMPALPPLPVLAVAVGICLHAPFSFMYHWTYAHALPAAARSKHWSRRMDQSMIHVCSAFMSYAVSGSWNFFLANALYNADCFRRQFRPSVRPKRNQARIFISVVAYTLPLLKQRGSDDDGDDDGTTNQQQGMSTFVQLWAVFTISGWLFSQYPVGGWSHAVFHIVIALAPPLLLQTAMHLSASAPQLSVAAACSAAAATASVKLRNQ